MKQFWTDLCLVLLLICVISLFFGDYNVSQTIFEESVSSGEKPKDQYVTIQDSSDNHVSSFLKTMSDGCVQVIQYIVLIFSNFVSMILTLLVY